MIAFVLCAGLGTRLRPLTDILPKPAVPVAGLPLIRYAFALAKGAGASRLVVNTHHLAESMASVAKESARVLELPLAVSHEPRIAGTGGALREARQQLQGDGTIVLMNGDILFDLDLTAALASHEKSGALATMVLMPMPAGASYATVETESSGQVRRIAKKFGPGGEALTSWHFTGVHLLDPAILDRVPLQHEVDVNREVYPPLMVEGAVRGYFVAPESYWNDLGAPERYLAANLDVVERRLSLARFAGLDPFAGMPQGSRQIIGHGALVHPTAQIRDGAILGEGVTVGAKAVVDRSVVWAGTQIEPEEFLRDSIAAGPVRIKVR